MTYQHLSLEIDQQVAHITIKRVAMHLPFMKELLEIAMECDKNDDIRAVLISSDQKLFSAGGDLAYFAESGTDIGAAIKELTVYLHSAISLFNRMDKPTICVVQGAAAGAGMSFAVQCDFVIASEKASFSGAYTAAGLSPDGSSSYFLPRLIGERRAKEMLITNRKVGAQEALEWGLVNQVVEAGTELEAGKKLAQQLAAGPSKAFGSVKQLIQRSSTESLESQMALEAEMIASNAGGEDGQEGINAFLEKRRAEFKGRR
ncbi:enoyl-CoA hydratase [Pseudomaricurvus alkylphenolicus]|jgi:2-(1,2-epoxy-1,2-dihydrophenyl)acetyl-CoA isomerase|uniref:enoyl-CoA hydratase/isomerase family protein n=1 Tax=Pseudomaricurvus alkylphenolicus TaxID=1306991 RepID=UPI0014231E45|nr:enoyl-CoA hydratase-related protein [Pseudomaricurvus alkylphenolicus]NIB39815.1 enoyl-CoA hydratase [Pseudomaricurvus alkylphenolicus]